MGFLHLNSYAEGKKIQAIKGLRSVSRRNGLKECKEAFDMVDKGLTPAVEISSSWPLDTAIDILRDHGVVASVGDIDQMTATDLALRLAMMGLDDLTVGRLAHTLESFSNPIKELRDAAMIMERVGY